MNSISKLLLVAAAMFAFATVALIGSPAKSADAQVPGVIEIEKICDGDVEGSPFTIDLGLLGGPILTEVLLDTALLDITATADISALGADVVIGCDASIFLNPQITVTVVGDPLVGANFTIAVFTTNLLGVLDIFGPDFDLTVAEPGGVLSGACAGGTIDITVAALTTGIVCTITNTGDTTTPPDDDDETLEEILEILRQIRLLLLALLANLADDVDVDIDQNLINALIAALINQLDVDIDNNSLAALLASLIQNQNVAIENNPDITLEDLLDLQQQLRNINELELENDVRNELDLEIDLELDNENELDSEIDNDVDVDNDLDADLENKLENKNELNNDNINNNTNNNEQNQDQTNDQNVNVSTGDVIIGDDDDKKRDGGRR